MRTRSCALLTKASMRTARTCRAVCTRQTVNAPAIALHAALLVAAVLNVVAPNLISAPTMEKQKEAASTRNTFSQLSTGGSSGEQKFPHTRRNY